MSTFGLLARLGIYYGVMALVMLLVLWLYPGWQEGLPIGRTQALLAQAGDITTLADGIPKMEVENGPFQRVPGFVGSLVWLAVAILGAMLAALPVSWVYMTIRNPRDYDQSLVDTIIVLPIVVTSIVVVVQHSLALAFSLAGIAGAARYRNNMKSSGDLLFILLAISIGLAAGIGAVELAMLSSAAFNLCFVMLWATSYGERTRMKRFMAEVEHGDGHASGDGNGNGNGKTRKKHAAETMQAPEPTEAAAPEPPPPASADPLR